MEDDHKSANDIFGFQSTVTAQFGDMRWLPIMLEPLNRELVRIFTVQPSRGIPMRDRARYSASIGEIVKVFNAIGFAPIVVENFLELALALNELDNGTVRHFLKPNPTGNRTIDSGDIWQARAHVAIALDVIVQDRKRSETEASKCIAKSFDFLRPVLSPTSKDFAAAIRSWRKSFLNGKVADFRARISFENRQQYIQIMRDYLAGQGKHFTAPHLSAHIMHEAARLTLLAADAEAIELGIPRLRKSRKKPAS